MRALPADWVRVLVGGVIVLVSAAAFLVTGPTVAGADTDPTTLSGQGGSFLEPVVSKIIQDDDSNLSPLFGAYTATDSDSGIAAFVGQCSR